MGDGEPHPAAGPPRQGRRPTLRRTGRRPGPSGSTRGLVSRLRAPGRGYLQRGHLCATLCGWGCERQIAPSPPGADTLVKGIASMDWTKEPVFNQVLPPERITPYGLSYSIFKTETHKEGN